MSVQKTQNIYDNFAAMFKLMSLEVFTNASNKGFWDEERNEGEAIALMHSELSEALEGLRKGNKASDKIPSFLAVEEELADTIIRIMDFASGKGYNVADAIIAKHFYNQSRPHKHGKDF